MARSAVIQPVAAEAVKADRNPFAGVLYRWWWAMSLCMSLAVGVQLVTVPTYVLDRTETRFYVALAVLAQTVPTALFTLAGGAVADRIGRGRILLVTTAIGLAAAGVYVLLAGADVRPVWPVLPVAAVIGAAAAFQNPARQSLINALAPGARLQNGVIWGTMAYMAGQSFLGPALGGFVVWGLGLTAGFGTQVLLLAVALLCAMRLRGLPSPPPAKESMWTGIKRGLGYVTAHPSIWQVLTLGVVPGLCFIGVVQPAFPVLARDTFGTGAAGIALLSMGMGAGVIVGSIWLTKWGPREGRGRWIILSLPAGGAVFVLAGLAPALALSVGMLFLFGLAAAVFINLASTLLQTYAEPAFLGRVMSVYSLCFLVEVTMVIL
jgi:MFS family permease